MDLVLPEHKNHWKTLLDAANHHITMGVVAASNTKCQRYWRHWQDFVQPHSDDYLQSLPRKEQISVCQAVIEWTRQGKLGRGMQIKAGLVQDAISAIGKNFELEGYENPPTNQEQQTTTFALNNNWNPLNEPTRHHDRN